MPKNPIESGGGQEPKDSEQKKMFGGEGEYRYPSTTDPDKELETAPSYTDHRFNKEQDVFGAKEENLSYDYSDRLVDFDRKEDGEAGGKVRTATEAANQSGANPKTQRWYENYLSAYFGEPVELRHIVVGVNKSNGWYYQVFGYRFKNAKVYEMLPGYKLEGAVENMIELAQRQNRNVASEFNGVKFIVDSNSKAENIVAEVRKSLK